jgi:sugar/nucleoside kinase (ribokinase family)
MGLSAPRRAVGLCSFGDAVIDVVISLSRLPVVDDDVPAEITLVAGGQAANVAAWCAALGARSRLVTKLGTDVLGRLARDSLEFVGVEVLTPAGCGATGVVASMVTPDGSRSMASDRRAIAEFAGDELEDAWFDDCAWLHVSGYALFGERSCGAALEASRLARERGARVSVDLSTALLVGSLGRQEVQRRVQSCGASLVFANAAEYDATGHLDVATTVVKRGARGCLVIEPGSSRELAALPATVVADTTGAGDAFAAGWLLGGPDLALRAARTCLGSYGAMPRMAASMEGTR